LTPHDRARAGITRAVVLQGYYYDAVTSFVLIWIILVLL
jgi:hypothetical protein